MGRATELSGNLSEEQNISIHALRGEGDCNWLRVDDVAKRISIHALRGEGDRLLLGVGGIILNLNPRQAGGRGSNYSVK